MASGGKGGGSGSWLLTGLGIGAALGAAYIGFKAWEHEKACHNSSRRRRREDKEEEQEGSRGIASARSTSPESTRDRGRAAVEPRRREPVGTLLDQLHRFYSTHINTSSQTSIRDKVAKVRDRLNTYLMKNHRKLVAGELMLAALEGLYSRPQDSFKLALPLAFDPKLWELEDVLDVPGAFRVHRNEDSFMVGQSHWDHYLVDKYLSPELVGGFWTTAFQQINCIAERSAGQVELFVQNPVDPHGIMICIQLIPSMKFQSEQGAVTITSEAVACGQVSAEDLWLHSKEDEAVEELRALDEDGGCRQICLAILDNLLVLHCPLKLLTTYGLVTVLLTLCQEETEWEPSMLAERFQDLLRALEGHLQAGTLMDYYNQRVNLFTQYGSLEVIHEMKLWLALKLKNKEQISALLCV